MKTPRLIFGVLSDFSIIWSWFADGIRKKLEMGWGGRLFNNMELIYWPQRTWGAPLPPPRGFSCALATFPRTWDCSRKLGANYNSNHNSWSFRKMTRENINAYQMHWWKELQNQIQSNHLFCFEQMSTAIILPHRAPAAKQRCLRISCELSLQFNVLKSLNLSVELVSHVRCALL